MGSFYIADAVTGTTIRRGDPVIAILINYDRAPSYPRSENLNQPPLYPHDLFRPVSLPVRGFYDDYGRVIVKDGAQPGVAVASKMAKGFTWDQIQDKGLSWRDGLTLTEIRTSKLFSPEKGRETGHRIYGQMVVHASTYRHLLGSTEKRQTDVATILSALEKCRLDMVLARSEARAGNRDYVDRMFTSAYHLASLRYDGRAIKFLDGTTLKLPGLAGVLSRMDGGLSMDPDFIDFVTDDDQTLFNFDMLERSEPLTGVDDLSAILGALWDMQAFSRGLARVNKLFLPSPTAGQDGNAADAFGIGLATVAQCLDELKGEEDYGSDDTEKHVTRMLAELDKLRANARKLQKRLRAGSVGS